MRFLNASVFSAVGSPVVCAVALSAAVFPSLGCSKIAGWAIDKAIGDDAGLAESALSGGGTTSGTSSGKKVCDLVTDAEIEAASGKKIVTKEGGDSDCSWTLSATGKEDQASMGSITLQVVPEIAVKIIPMLGAPKAIPGVGDKAEWIGGMAPNLRVHVKGGQVLNFMFVDPQAMMKNPGVSETKINSNTTAVNMEYPELEKEAIAVGKAAAGRY